MWAVSWCWWNDSRCSNISIKINPRLQIFSILKGTWNNFLGELVNVIVSVLASGAVDYGFEPWLGTTEEYEIGICCFSTKHVALRSKNKDWLAWNQNNVSKWSNMSISGLLFQDASIIEIQLSMFVQYKAYHLIKYTGNLFSPWYSWKITHLALNNNHSWRTPYFTALSTFYAGLCYQGVEADWRCIQLVANSNSYWQEVVSGSWWNIRHNRSQRGFQDWQT